MTFNTHIYYRTYSFYYFIHMCLTYKPVYLFTEAMSYISYFQCLLQCMIK